jgi:shikimate kinase
MHSRIYLIGFMGSGKTKNGKKIARRLDYSFVDMDEYIEQKAGMTVKDIFREKGEAWFRRAETDAIKELASKENIVISTGGGVPCHGDNMDLLNENGLTVYLKLSPSSLFKKLKKSKKERPLLDGKSDKKMLRTIKELLREREQYYNRADLIVEDHGDVPDRVVDAIDSSWSLEDRRS